MAKKYKQFRIQSSAAQVDTVVIPEQNTKQILIETIWMYAGHANDIVKFYPAKLAGKTTLVTAVTTAGTTCNLTGDAGVKNTLNGVAVAAADFVLLATASGYELFEISSVDAAGANGVITINGITFNDGIANFSDAAPANATAYVIWAEDVAQFAAGSISVATQQTPLKDFWAGNLGHPVAMSHVGGGAALHYSNGIAKYVEQIG